MFQLLRIAHSLMMLHFPTGRIIVMVTIAVATLSGCETLPGQGSPGSANTASAQRPANEMADVQTKLGIGYLREGNLEVAFRRLTRALQADPDYSTAHNAMGTLQERLGNTEAAEQHFRKAVALSPTNSSAQSNFGSFLCRTGRYDEGEQRFLQALKNSLYDRPEVAFTNAGLCMQSAGNEDKAEAYFRSALERNSRIPSALVGMAQISYDTSRFLPARAYLQRYQELSKLNAKNLWLGVRVERELGDQDAQNRYATRLSQQFPDSNEARELELLQ